MEYRTLAETKEVAAVHPVDSRKPLSKRERLERWADLLDDHGGSLRSLYETEFAPRHKRRTMREDNSPLSVAFADPVLRGQGLQGDAYGDAIDFFGLSHGELHHILCYCHCGHMIRAGMIATRVREAASRVRESTGYGLQACIVTASAVAAAAIAALF
ncbi:MAG TPA: hypothetical protein VGD08_04545 [Stellaceae bacterium]|jgi:hypothetical protein